MRDIIEIEKELMPYAVDIVLASEEFNLEFMYNEKADLFTCTLRKDDDVLVYSEPIIYGVELFKDVYKSGKFPMISIVPLDESGEQNKVTYENFGKTVFLTIDDEDEDENEDGNESGDVDE